MSVSNLPLPPDQYMSTRDVARTLGVTPSCVLSRRSKGDIEGIQIESQVSPQGYAWIFERSEVARFEREVVVKRRASSSKSHDTPPLPKAKATTPTMEFELVPLVETLKQIAVSLDALTQKIDVLTSQQNKLAEENCRLRKFIKEAF